MVVTRVPDIVVTRAMSFVWAGFALLVRSAPGGSAAHWLTDLVIGQADEQRPREAATIRRGIEESVLCLHARG